MDDGRVAREGARRRRPRSDGARRASATLMPSRGGLPMSSTLAELEVTVGCRTEPLRYCPDAAVNRAQMATFSGARIQLETDVPSAGFADTNRSVHATHIDALADARITRGCASEPARYCPDRPVTRAQMASFLNRARSMVRYTAVTAGPYHACGLRTEGTITCWGDNHSGQARAARWHLQRSLRRMGPHLRAPHRRHNRLLGLELPCTDRGTRRHLQRSLRRMGPHLRAPLRRHNRLLGQ